MWRRWAAILTAVTAGGFCAMVPAAAAEAARSTATAGAPAIASGGAWGTAREVPGLAALNTGGDADLGSVSCASAGNCGAGGFYQDGSGNDQAFVVSEKNGAWGTAKQVPGTAALNTGGDADLGSVSCASAGNCSAGGSYLNSSARSQPFIVGEKGGTWGKAQKVSGLAALKAIGAGVASVSCGSAGNCAAGGSYEDGSFNNQVFVVSEKHGAWGTAKQVPGTAALNTGGEAGLASVSCGSAGNCAAGGSYQDSSGHVQVFVANEKNGTWGKAEEVPGSAALNAAGVAGLESVSCGSAGNCAAGGFYRDSLGHGQAWVVSEKNGTWGKAKEVPGTAALNGGGGAELDSLSCASAGDCSAGGTYLDASARFQAFVVSEEGGTWGSAEEVPGSAALNAGGNAQISSVSCGSAGNCAAGGFYEDGSDHDQALVVSQVGGTWGSAEQVPGSAALNAGGFAQTGPVSCGSASNCGAGGLYKDGSGHVQAFIVNKA